MQGPHIPSDQLSLWCAHIIIHAETASHLHTVYLVFCFKSYNQEYA